MIDVHAIQKSYRSAGTWRSRGRPAVDGVSFSVQQGQIAGLLGPNGAGKSTTIRIITGYLRQDAGSVTVNSHDTIDAPLAARASVGYLPESAPLYPEMTPEAYLRYRAKLFGVPPRDRKASVDRAIDRCWLGPMRRRRIGALSKGYKQRVGLAASLLHNPPVLVLDEPSNGLDPQQIRETRSLVRELAEDRTMLVSSHILAEIERTCDKVVMIAAGRVLADGSLDELRSSQRRTATRTTVVEAKTSSNAWLDGLESVTIAGTESSEGWTRYQLTSDSDPREAISEAAASAGIRIRELTSVEPGLEQLFLDILEAEGAAA